MTYKKSAFEDDNYFSGGKTTRFDALYGYNTVIPKYSCRITKPEEKQSILEFIGGTLKWTAVNMGIFYVIFEYWEIILEYLPYILEAL